MGIGLPIIISEKIKKFYTFPRVKYAFAENYLFIHIFSSFTVANTLFQVLFIVQNAVIFIEGLLGITEASTLLYGAV